MPLQLPIDDISIGQHIALLPPKPEVVNLESPRRGGKPIRMRIPAGAMVEPPVSPGIPLKVLGLNLPFALAGVLVPGGGYSGPVVIDLHNFKVMAVTDSYVRAVDEFEAKGPQRRGGPELEACSEDPTNDGGEQNV